jgi:DNA gyrase subunit A
MDNENIEENVDINEEEMPGMLPASSNGGDLVVSRQIEDEMRTSYIDYAMSVIIGRALPDVRDGLKPVHRRILFAMNELGFTHTKPFKKSARIVGDVLGKYHPHGDTAVYDAMVRMAQSFSLRYTFIDGHGNFGSVDGDSAAAMRYTEARLARIAEEMLDDIDKETVEFRPNYDESLQEPEVLPAKLPSLLINGSSGIAVGMATNIPPHNLNEIVDAAVALIDNPHVAIEDLMQIVSGPDFPTGGIIHGIKGIRSAYETGRGRVVIRARAEIDESGKRPLIIVTELPYQVNKSRLLEKIALLVREKKTPEIADLRDESDRRGMRVVVTLKRDCIPSVVLNKLYKHTDLEVTFGVIMLAIVDNRPKVLNLREILRHFVDHRLTIVKRRVRFLLRKAEERAHILEGLLIALDNIDRAITIIRASKSQNEAIDGLMDAFELTEIQARAILDMKLQRLVGLEREKIKAEYDDLKIKIDDFKDILSSTPRVLSIIKEELLYLKEKFGDERKTEITASSADFSMEDLIANVEVAITVSHSGYIKRQRLDNYKSQHRGGKGMSASQMRDEDFIKDIFIAKTHDYMLFFTDKGKVYWLKVYDIPEGSRQSMGRPIINMINIENNEKILTMKSVDLFDSKRNLFFTTKKGIVKKTNLTAYSRPRSGGIRAIIMDDGDELVDVKITSGDSRIIIGTAFGKSIQFSENDVRSMGRVTRGVKGITLKTGDRVVGMDSLDEDFYIVSITEKGYGKKTLPSKFSVQHRGGQGVICIKTDDRNGHQAAFRQVRDDQDIMIITEKGMVIRIHAEDVPVVGRNTKGVRIIRLNEDDKVVGTALAPRDDADEEPGASDMTVLADGTVIIPREISEDYSDNESELEESDIDDSDIDESDIDVTEDDDTEDDIN